LHRGRVAILVVTSRELACFYQLSDSFRTTGQSLPETIFTSNTPRQHVNHVDDGKLPRTRIERFAHSLLPIKLA
jgi:hypothetical protein